LSAGNRDREWKRGRGEEGERITEVGRGEGRKEGERKERRRKKKGERNKYGRERGSKERN
jgi:hypothetical protein